MPEKLKIGQNVYPFPMPVVLVGATVEDRANFLAVGWVARVNGRPPIMAVGLNQRHHTPIGIQECGAFSINVPSADLVTRTDFCGLHSGRTTDKSNLFDLFYGELGTAPLIRECPLCLECKLVETVTLPSHYLFLGEVVSVYADENCLTGGRPDMKKLNPFLLTMPDNRYWALGQQLGSAWSIGRELEG